MQDFWIIIVYAAVRRPIGFLRSLFAHWRSEPRSNRLKNANRNALAEHFGMTREELDDLLREMTK